jgi:hypothetical protein
VDDYGNLTNEKAGFGYSFLNPKLQAYSKAYRAGGVNFNEFSGHMDDFLQPLVNQPGETFEYGVSIFHCVLFNMFMLSSI